MQGEIKYTITISFFKVVSCVMYLTGVTGIHIYVPLQMVGCKGEFGKKVEEIIS
jgi:hypothetical protein